MGNQAVKRVLDIDYVMTRILSDVSRKDQYLLLKCCQRLRYLVINCVWKQDWKQMDRVQTFCLTDDEFLECLHLNAKNVEKLTIYLNDDNDFQKYFPGSYENLMELKIDGMYKCEWESFATLHTLEKLQVLKLKDLTNIVRYGDVWSLAAKVPLTRFDLQGVHISMTAVDLQNRTELQGLEGLTIVNTCCPHTCAENKDCLQVLGRSPNLKEFKIILHEALVDGRFDKFRHLERVRILGCRSAALKISAIMKQTKHLHVWVDRQLDDKSEINAHDYAYLQTLDVTLNTTTCYCSYWTALFKSPVTSFKNLQHLRLDLSVDDQFVWWISVKCPQLEKLVLSGRQLSRKYINHLRNLQDLKLSYRRLNWSNLYAILLDLKLLESLTLRGVTLKKDKLPNAPIKRNFGKSLKFVQLPFSILNDQRFWKYISKNSEGSFQKLRSVITNQLNVCTYNLRAFFANIPQLHELHFESTQNISFSGDMIPSVKLLLFGAGRQIDWKNIVNILKDSHVQILEILEEAGDDNDCSDIPEYSIAILKRLHSITMPFKYYETNADFWRQHLMECDHFQLRCIGVDAKEVIKILPLLLGGDSQKERVKSIYMKVGIEAFSTIRKYYEGLSLSNVPMFYLDDTNKRLCTETYKICNVVIIEV